MVAKTFRNFGKVGEKIEIPNLVEIQRKSYADFLQRAAAPTKRKCSGLESLFWGLYLKTVISISLYPSLFSSI